MTSTWVGAWGLMSRKARARAVSATRWAGTSPATIAQKRQSATGRSLLVTPRAGRRHIWWHGCESSAHAPNCAWNQADKLLPRATDASPGSVYVTGTYACVGELLGVGSVRSGCRHERGA